MKRETSLCFSTALLLPLLVLFFSFSKKSFRPDELEGVYLRTESNYGLSGVYTENVIYLLYKNGDVAKDIPDDPSTIDAAASKKKFPKKWGRWIKTGKKITVTWSNGKTVEWNKWFIARPGTANKTLSGSFKSADLFGGNQVMNYNTVSFNNQQFDWGKIKGGNTSWKPVYTASKTAGTYVIDNYTITFSYNDGKTEKFFFCYYPSDLDHFVIGSSHFVPKK